MSKAETTTLRWMFLIGAIIFLLMIPPNMTGAKTAEMLSVFEVDEYAQYSHVIRMLTPGETLYQSLRNFFIYQHYFYGFPFYFFSALSLLPIRFIMPDWTANTTLIVTWLRQMISVLPMIAAVMLLVITFIGLKRCRVALGAMVFLLSMPVIVQNNFWWHPDSLSFFFIALVFYFLNKDELRFGKYFWLAAVACGFAVGTKLQGLFFAGVIPVLLILGISKQKISIGNALKKGILFIVVMIGALIISNPLLLLPQERSDILSVQKRQIEQTSLGTFTLNQNQMLEGWSFSEPIEKNYAGSWFFVLAAGGCLTGLRGSPSDRLRSLLLITYLLVAGMVLFNSPTVRTYYLLPFALPLFAGYGNYFQLSREYLSKEKQRWFNLLFALIALIPLVLNLRTDWDYYLAQITREQTSGSLQFYQAVESEVLPVLNVKDRTVRILKDWKVYFPQQAGIAVAIDWDMITAETIEREYPDLILLEQENMRAFSDPGVVTDAVDPHKMSAIHKFYKAASADELPGFKQVFSDHFGAAFVREDLVLP
ncbi:MAG: phospholipid carrier-dependent glycosyltransferase [Chloroflexi bacterium]|nr:phospholipid carrier-dependent glycosyltransferase [Chloroflexota bacterium]